MIDPVEARFGALVSALEPAARKALATEIAKSLRASEAARIAAQKNPDGSDYEPRKHQLRRRKKNLRAGMFAKLRTGRFLKSRADADQAVVTFANEVQRIARVHQLGLRDRVDRKTGVETDYPVRKLLGITDAAATLIEGLVINHLSRLL